MNHGLKINNNVLEITLPEEVHIDKVIVNRQIFSQRTQVCKSCKYHGLEGHEEPCVSCEVGNSNYVPSVEQEERTEERTETHACDCISRQAAIDVAKQHWYKPDIAKALKELPSAEPERKNGEWIEIDDDRISGRCSVCGWEAHLYEDDVVGMDYCPNCGARLLEGEQDE